MIREFIFSKEGFEYLDFFNKKYDCYFIVLEPSGKDLVLSYGGKYYKIPEEETIDNFKLKINESLKKGINAMLEQYDIIEDDYEEGMDY